MENYVHFDDSYFKKTIREYQDWRMAFFRETAQNSVDAKSKNIAYTIEEIDGKIVVTCDDDGTGMNENILLNKFLVMGGTYKESEDDIGGFGYAKSIILFCHGNYEIYTNDNYIVGSYGRFSNIEKVERRKGTLIKVEIDKELVSVYSLTDKLKEWVKKASLKQVVFTLNGEILEQETAKFKYKKEITIGTLQFDDDPELYKSSISIRMRGMPMFEREIWGNSNACFKGYVDLNFSSSLDCLTSNRDGLLKEYDNALNQLIQDLTTERSKYTTDKLSEFLINEHTTEDIFEHDTQAVAALESLIKEEDDKSFRPRANNLLTENTEEVDIFKKLKNEKLSIAEKIEQYLGKIVSSEYPKSFLVKIDSLDGESNRAMLKHYNNTVKLINQKRNIKMAEVWNGYLEKSLEALSKDQRFYIQKHNGIYSYLGKKIHTGFVFSTDAQCYGLNVEKQDDIYIMLNILIYRRDNLNIGDLRHILIHEIAHIFERYHSDQHGSYMFLVDKALRDSKVKF